MAKKEKAAVSLPKRLAGVKIPKAVRENLTKLAKHPMVADLLAAGLVALAASLREEPKDKKPTAKGKAKPIVDKEQVAEATAEIAAAVATQAVKTVRKAATVAGDKAPPAVRKAATAAAKNPVVRKAADAAGKAAVAAATAKPAATKAPAKPKAPAKAAAKPKAPAKPKAAPKAAPKTA